MESSEILRLKKLEENQDMLRFAIEAAELGTWDLNPETNTFSGNDRLKEWFGLTPDEAIDLSIATNIIAEKDRATVIKAIETAMDYSSGGDYEIEYTIIHPKTKQERIVKAKGKATFDENKKASRLNGILLDVTKEAVAQRKLGESEAYFRSLTNALPAIVWITRTDGYCIFLNKSWYDYTGQTQAEAEGFGWLNAVHPDDAEMSAEAFKYGYANEEPVSVLYRLRNNKGEYRWAIDSGSPKYDREGKYEGFVGTVVDVHEQVEAESKVKLNEQRLKVLIDESPMRVTFLSGPDLVIELANEKMLRSWGKDRSVLGRSLEEAIPELQGQNYLKILKEVYEKGLPYIEKEAEVWYKDGEKLKHLYLDIWYKPLHDIDGQVYGILATAVDVTDKVDTQKIIEDSELRFRSLIEESSIATCLFTGEDMVVEIANENMIKIWGKDRESVIGKPLLEAVPELVGQPFFEILQEILRTGVAYSATDEPAILKVDGVLDTYYFDFTYKPLFDGEGKIYGIMDSAIDVTEKVRNRKKLEESEGRFRSLIAAAPVAIGLFVGRDLVIEMPNQTFNDIVGKGDVTGWTLREAMPELVTEGQPFLQILDDVYTKGEMFQTFGTQVKIVQNGVLTHNYYDFTYTPIFNAEGEVYAILDIAIDVTENVMALQRIEESEKNLRNTIVQAPVAMCIFKGPNHVVEIANEKMIEIWGKSKEQTIGKPFIEGLPEIKGKGFEEILDEVYRTGIAHKDHDVAVDLFRNNTWETIYVDYVYEVFRETDGTISGILSVATDVTQQVLARRKIEEAEQKAQLAIESADLGPYETDLVSDEMKTSERFNEIWGLKKHKKVTRSELMSYIHPEDLEIRQKAHDESLVTGNLDYEARVIGNDDTERWVRIKGKLTYSEDGNPNGLIGVIQDITEQKRFAEELTKQVRERTLELQRSNDDLLQFAHVASHDLKEPVRKIKIFSNMLENDFKELMPERGQSYLSKIQTSTDRMFSMIEGVLAYSAITSSERPIDEIDLNDVMENIESDLEILIQKKEAVLQKDKLPVIEGASVLIYQLFYNLINNALKFSKKDLKPLITIESAVIGANEKRMAKIVITDNGIGLDPDYVHKIFDVFSRLNAKDEYEGTGLGLALCKKIVQRHHGSIQASGVKGEKAIFTLLLPVIQGQKII